MQILTRLYRRFTAQTNMVVSIVPKKQANSHIPAMDSIGNR
jgi:hypothetical protein